MENSEEQTNEYGMKESTRQWAAELFGIKPEEILWYNSGSCYDRIGVTTVDAAEKVAKYVEGETANGGMLDGMPLGGRTPRKKEGSEEIEYYDVTC